MTDSVPRISAVISSYNFARYLPECVESVLAQTLQPFEIIISDDSSTDDSWSIINEYSQRYPQLIRAFRHTKNLGPPRHGSFSRQQARGDLIIWMDGDDRWLPRLLEVQLTALQKEPSAQVACSNVCLVDSVGNRLKVWDDGTEPEPPSGDVFVEVFSRRFFPNSRSVFRNYLVYRVALEQTGYNDPDLESYWDWDGKIRLTSRFRVSYTGEALVEYRVHEGGFSRSQPSTHLRGMVGVYEKNLPLLSSRTLAEAARVKCNIESLIALRQLELPPSERVDRYSASRVCDRNRKLLEELTETERAALEHEVGHEFQLLALRASRDEAMRGNLRLALRYWQEFLRYHSEGQNLKTIARIVLPWRAYTRFGAINRRLQQQPYEHRDAK
jgi:glycosyltransferase involved in cell wall biosynthesis